MAAMATQRARVRQVRERGWLPARSERGVVVGHSDDDYDEVVTQQD